MIRTLALPWERKAVLAESGMAFLEQSAGGEGGKQVARVGDPPIVGVEGLQP